MAEIRIIDMGILIGNYLRETNRFRPEWLSQNLSDEQVGGIIFNSDRNGELSLFFELYDEAEHYYSQNSG